MKIGILEAGHAPDEIKPRTGDYGPMFARLLDGHDFTFEFYDVEGMVFPASVTECDGWLITGSRHGAYEDHAFIPPLEDFIRAAVAADVPLVGVCFGHQIIAQALGGRVEKFAGGWAVGRQTYRWGDEDVAINAWHQDQVTALPEGATVLASDDFCRNAAVVYDRRAFTVQAHPEYGDDFIRDLADHRGRGVVPDDLLAVATARNAAPPDQAKLAARMAKFFKERDVS